jgi:D-inositol-3-phosphate glycosyltransferase
MTGLSQARHGHDSTVLIVCHYYPPHVGGIEEVARTEARGLSAQGVSVTVMTSSPGARRGASPVDSGVRVVRVAALNTLQRFGVPFPLFFLPSLIRHSWIEVQRADVVHVHETLYLSSWVVALCCQLRGTPMVVTKHVDVVAHPWPIVATVQKVVYGTVGRFVSHRAEIVFYVNSSVRDSLLLSGTPPDRLVPLPNGVDLVMFVPPASAGQRQTLRQRFSLPLDAPLVLFVGRLVHKKGFRSLVEAAERQDSWVAVLVGDGERVERSGRVRPFGSLDRDTLRLLYQACDIFALPSQNEGFPLTVQEAMASGLPIVTTDDPGYEMYGLDPAMITLLPVDSPHLDDVIAELIADPDQRGRMSTYSRRFAENNFSWDQHVVALTRAYQQVVDRRRSGSRLVNDQPVHS